jgi:hypothetical protein
MCAYNNPRFGVTADQTYTDTYYFITATAAYSSLVTPYIGSEIQPIDDVNNYLPYAQAEFAAVTNAAAAGYKAKYIDLYSHSGEIATTALGGGSFIPACGPTGIDLVGSLLAQGIASSLTDSTNRGMKLNKILRMSTH